MRHLLLSLCSFVVAATTLVGCADGPADELPKMVGKSAEQLAKDHAATLKLLTHPTNENKRAPTPWHVWKFSAAKNETRYVVFSGQHLESIPGQPSASVHLVSASGAELGSLQFSTGWRSDVKSASLSFDDQLQAPLIVITSAPAWGGADVRKQYFALVDDKLYFIRIEDSKGRLVRNHYLSPNYTLGGDLPVKDEASWSALLQSPKLPLRLAALTYLSGIHMNPDKPRRGVLSETIADANLAHAFRRAESTKKRIEDYRKSENTWLREAADLAATPCEAASELFPRGSHEVASTPPRGTVAPWHSCPVAQLPARRTPGNLAALGRSRGFTTPFGVPQGVPPASCNDRLGRRRGLNQRAVRVFLDMMTSVACVQADPGSQDRLCMQCSNLLRIQPQEGCPIDFRGWVT